MDSTTADTIFAQLGGKSRLSAMVNARCFSYDSAADFGVATFRFTNPAAGQPNHCRVILQADDTYHLIFTRIRGIKSKVIWQHHDVFAEDLIPLFERCTGLRIQL